MRARAILTGILGCLAIVGVALLSATPRAAAEPGDPGAFMTEVSSQVLQLLQDKTRSEAERERQFETLVDQNFDMARIARFVLGSSWRATSDDEKQKFVTAFHTYMVRIYWGRFRQYNSQQFRVLNQVKQSDAITLVQSEIVQQQGQPPAKVDWTVARTASGYKIIDVSIAGVSQSLTYRDEFASIIARNGGQIGPLIGELQKRNAG